MVQPQPSTQGASDAYAKAFVKGFLDEVGFHGDLLIQTDSEPSIRDFARAVAQQRTARTLLRTTAVGNHQANGGVERWIQSVCGLARTLRADLEGNYGVSVQSGSVLVPWMIRHAGWLLSRYGQDGERRTPHQKVHRQAYQGEVVNFGETVWVRSARVSAGPSWRTALCEVCGLAEPHMEENTSLGRKKEWFVAEPSDAGQQKKALTCKPCWSCAVHPGTSTVAGPWRTASSRTRRASPRCVVWASSRRTSEGFNRTWVQRKVVRVACTRHEVITTTWHARCAERVGFVSWKGRPRRRPERQV